MDAAVNSLFVFPETGEQVRTVMIDGEPWFVAADVCRCLGMSVVYGAHQWIRGLSSDEKRTVTIADHPEIFSGSMARSAALASEAGLYKMVMRSTKPSAQRFQNWVTRDVLPAIRKDGAYVRGEELLKPGVVETLDLNDLTAVQDQIERFLKLKAELLERRVAEEQARREAAEAKVAEQAPAVSIFRSYHRRPGHPPPHRRMQMRATV